MPIPPGLDEIPAEKVDLSLGDGTPGECVYFTWEPQRRGLMRARWEENGLWLEHLDRAGVWIFDPNLVKRLIGAPDWDFVKISEEEARQIIEAREGSAPSRSADRTPDSGPTFWGRLTGRKRGR